jgi:hypothetical protein
MESRTGRKMKAERPVKGHTMGGGKAFEPLSQKQHVKRDVTPTYEVPYLQVHVYSYSMRLVVVDCAFEGRL